MAFSFPTSFARVFTRYSEQIAQWAFLLSSLSLIIKNIDQPWTDFQVRMDLLAAVLFLVSCLCYGLLAVDRNYIRPAGASILLASLALCAGGYRGIWDDPSLYLQIISMLPTIIAGVFFMGGQISIGVLPELLFRPVHMAAGIMQGDIGQCVFSILGAIGGIALIVTDRKHKKTGS